MFNTYTFLPFGECSHPLWGFSPLPPKFESRTLSLFTPYPISYEISSCAHYFPHNFSDQSLNPKTKTTHHQACKPSLSLCPAQAQTLPPFVGECLLVGFISPKSLWSQRQSPGKPESRIRRGLLVLEHWSEAQLPLKEVALPIKCGAWPHLTPNSAQPAGLSHFPAQSETTHWCLIQAPLLLQAFAAKSAQPHGHWSRLGCFAGLLTSHGQGGLGLLADWPKKPWPQFSQQRRARMLATNGLPCLGNLLPSRATPSSIPTVCLALPFALPFDLARTSKSDDSPRCRWR